RFEIARAPFPPIRGEVRRPEGRHRGTVLLVHGFKGFARWGFFPYLADVLARGGVRAISFDMSGSGIGPDGESFTELDAFRDNTVSRELQDVALVRDHARKAGWLEHRYGVFGHSRGGGIAILHAATDPDVASIATWSAIATIARWSPDDLAHWHADGEFRVTNARTGQVLTLGPAFRDEVERQADTELSITAAASRLTIPWLLAHGTADETVPFEEAELLRASAAGAQLRFTRIGGASHTMDSKHPLPIPLPPRLDRVVTMTVDFFRSTLT
ncbi:MAG TPA: alpha/beta fold hydrolase, partial [Gemmatimonadaceae bacterium]|nr:alpha/beta fold hydrolase [Gemmatimonadaceae bacterium]